MDNNVLWSLRLGFSAKQASAIEKEGLKKFLKKSFDSSFTQTEPAFLAGLPRTQEESKKVMGEANASPETKKALQKITADIWENMRSWWLRKMAEDTYPLREKMVVFLHNHYVASQNNVGLTIYAYQHNQLLREGAFSNFRELTKKVVRSNAVIWYLNNNSNVQGKYNENLSRELLELFTLGVGNYTEQDIKNGAKGLAGLGVGLEAGKYNPAKENNDAFEYLGRTGNFKSDAMVDVIFSQKDAPYHITRKLLKWFIYDTPPEELVKYYGDYLAKVDYEIKPFLEKVFTEEYKKATAGSNIKDPLVFILQVIDELGIKTDRYEVIQYFLRNQNMELFRQPNVKGWDGGKSWLSAQLYIQRNTAADDLCKGKLIGKKMLPDEKHNNIPQPRLKNKGNNKQIIEELKARLLFTADEALQKNMETILPHDFNMAGAGADAAINRLFNYMIKTPEFQII